MNNTHFPSRRSLLPPVAAPFAASAVLAQSKKRPVGIELYSVRGELMKDLPGPSAPSPRWAIRSSSSTRRTSNWTTEQAKEVRKLLDELGIKCLSTHNGAQAISADNLNKTIELNQIIGSKYIIVASAGEGQRAPTAGRPSPTR